MDNFYNKKKIVNNLFNHNYNNTFLLLEKLSLSKKNTSANLVDKA